MEREEKLKRDKRRLSELVTLKETKADSLELQVA
jgi:hypothetical protein